MCGGLLVFSILSVFVFLVVVKHAIVFKRSRKLPPYDNR